MNEPLQGFINLWLHRVPGRDPVRKSASQGFDPGVAIVQKDERRTGALMLVRSGTVGDDPLFLIERQAGGIRFDLTQRDRDGAGNMTRFVRLSTTHVYDDGRPTVHRGPCFLERYTRDLCLRIWQIPRLSSEYRIYD